MGGAVAGRDPVQIHRIGPELSVLRKQNKTKKQQGPRVTRPDSVAGRRDCLDSSQLREPDARQKWQAPGRKMGKWPGMTEVPGGQARHRGLHVAASTLLLSTF